MPFVKSAENYGNFTRGRDLSEMVYQEDGGGEIVAFVKVDDLRPSDVVIIDSEYNLIVVQLQSHNQALPKLTPPLTPREEYQSLSSETERIDYIAQRLGLKE